MLASPEYQAGRSVIILGWDEANAKTTLMPFIVISPYAWEGKTRVVSNHDWAAVVLGGLLSAPPSALIILRPGWVRVVLWTG